MLFIPIPKHHLLLLCFSIRDITKFIAAAVMKEAIIEDLAEGYHDKSPKEMADMSEV